MSKYSGLAVQPTPGSDGPQGASDEGGAAQDSIFNLAEPGGAADDDGGQVRRTITMYRDGFVVDDGPYRRLDDPANAGFLRALAMGQTPPELAHDAGPGGITVGLIDKRKDEYVETFRSFSGAGATLGGGGNAASGSGAAVRGGTVDPASLPEVVPVDAGRPVTSIAVRLPNGGRRVVRVNLDMTVLQLAAHVRAELPGGLAAPFRIVSGFPPKPVEDYTATVEAAGLKGAQVQIQNA